MPPKHDLPAEDVEQPRPKRQRLTDSQLERKRELDREAQRTTRERTKNHIAHLEALVEQLQGDQSSLVQHLVAQLNESRAEVNRLKDALASITKISTSTLRANQPQPIHQLPARLKQETSSDLASEESMCQKYPLKYHATSQISTRLPPVPIISTDVSSRDKLQPSLPPIVNISPFELLPPQASKYDNSADLTKPDTNEQSSVEEFVNVCNEEPYTGNFSNSQLSVSQMAASILLNEKPEGRYWHLTGVLLTEILKTQQADGLLRYDDDEDIAIRAVSEGWSSVLARYPLDRGWQWLKELDEAIYFHSFGPAERLMNLRKCRYQFLHQCYPNAGWDKRLLNFHHVQTPEQQGLDHDPLVENFPVPVSEGDFSFHHTHLPPANPWKL